MPEEKLPLKVEEDVAGVQGSDADKRSSKSADDASAMDAVEVTAPDAGEIEWAGAVVKKAPGSGA